MDLEKARAYIQRRYEETGYSQIYTVLAVRENPDTESRTIDDLRVQDEYPYEVQIVDNHPDTEAPSWHYISKYHARKIARAIN